MKNMFFFGKFGFLSCAILTENDGHNENNREWILLRNHLSSSHLTSNFSQLGCCGLKIALIYIKKGRQMPPTKKQNILVYSRQAIQAIMIKCRSFRNSNNKFKPRNSLYLICILNISKFLENFLNSHLYKEAFRKVGGLWFRPGNYQKPEYIFHVFEKCFSC